MQTQDDERWSQQVADLHADGEAGQRFLDFFTLWFDGAETMMDEAKQAGLGLFPTQAARRALEMAENELGFLDVDLIGQMLTVAVMHWARGGDMAAGLTFIEHRVMEEALAKKIAALQTQAATE